MQEKSAQNELSIFQTRLQRLPLHHAPSIDILSSILPVNTFVYSRAVIRGVSIRTGLDKCPVYMAIKLLWLKPDKYYVTRKGSHLTSAQSSIIGLYSVRYSPLHIINSGLYGVVIFCNGDFHNTQYFYPYLCNKNLENCKAVQVFQLMFY